jgi:hypothetical protein
VATRTAGESRGNRLPQKYVMSPSACIRSGAGRVVKPGAAVRSERPAIHKLQEEAHMSAHRLIGAACAIALGGRHQHLRCAAVERRHPLRGSRADAEVIAGVRVTPARVARYV